MTTSPGGTCRNHQQHAFSPKTLRRASR